MAPENNLLHTFVKCTLTGREPHLHGVAVVHLRDGEGTILVVSLSADRIAGRALRLAPGTNLVICAVARHNQDFALECHIVNVDIRIKHPEIVLPVETVVFETEGAKGLEVAHVP